MGIVLRQIFPLGRFHATPWRVNPFDDPFGEWPPSPWRLVRAVVARWYQWCREEPDQANGTLDPLIRALCTSSYSFFLPPHAHRGNPVRQYFPVEFGWNPKEKKKAAFRSYGTSLSQDNYFCVPSGEAGAIWWFLEGDNWSDAALSRALNECLKRMTYFGRAEAFTVIEVEKDKSKAPSPNCWLVERRVLGAVPVLVPVHNATREDVERVTDDPEASGSSIPPGTRLMYAIRPAQPGFRETRVIRESFECTNLIQFAIGWNVLPEIRAIVRLTARFRGAVLREMLRLLTGDPHMTWGKASPKVRDRVAMMAGKDRNGKPLQGHRHTEYLVWCEDGQPVRLLAWRDSQPFDQNERMALLKAAGRQFSWAAVDDKTEAWRVRLVPLDRAVPPPPGFDATVASVWETVTPYVPPRHLLRKGKERIRESIESQIRRELTLRGYPDASDLVVEKIGSPQWVAVHMPRRLRAFAASIGDRRGYRLRLRFPNPVRGPIRLGHSSSFGLGLFRPIS